MARYIDADIIKYTEPLIITRKDGHALQKTVLNLALQYAKEAVDAIPDADVKPVIHAHKIHAHSQGGGTHWLVCSNCEKAIDLADVYCRYCGAIMDEEEGGDK